MNLYTSSKVMFDLILKSPDITITSEWSNGNVHLVGALNAFY